MTDDVELLRRYARDRSQEAFAELVGRHVDLVYAAALRRLGNDRQLAEDVTQEVFRDLARKAPELVNRSNLTGWLYTSARYAASRKVRGEMHRREREEEAQRMMAVDATASPAGLDQLQPVMGETIETLSPADREAVLLRFFEKRPFADIGALLGLSEDAAQKRVDRALDKLREAFARRGVTSTTAALSLALANQPVIAAPAGLAAAAASGALGAWVASGLAAGAIGSMTTAKTATAIATLAAVAAIGFGLAQRAQLREITGELQQIRRDTSAIDIRLARAERQLAQPPAIVQAPVPAAEEPSRPATAAPATVTVVEPPIDGPSFEATKEALASVPAGSPNPGLDKEHFANVRSWVGQDKPGLAQWIGTVAAGSQREHTTEAVMILALDVDPEFSFQLASSIERELPRRNRRVDVIRSWAKKDPDSAARAVAATELPDDERRMLTTFIEMTRRGILPDR